MANEVEIKVRTTGAQAAADEIDEVSDATRRMGRSASDESGKLDRLGETGGTVETRFLGLGAGISGVSTLMSGDAGPEDYAMAIADLGDSIEHTVIPALKNLSLATLTSIADTVKAGLAHVATAAQVVASWVLMGVQAMINAAKMAAAWLIGLGPVGLVIAAVAAIIAILIALGVGFDDVKRVALAVWNFILGLIKGVKDWIARNWPLLLAILTGPFGLAVLAISRNWQTIKDGATAVKDWVVDKLGDVADFITGLPDMIIGGIGDAVSAIGGFASDIASAIKGALNSALHLPFTIHGPGPLPDFTIPAFHSGGTFRAAPGRKEGLALLKDEERILPPGMTAAGGSGGITIIINGSLMTEQGVVGDLVNALRDKGIIP